MTGHRHGAPRARCLAVVGGAVTGAVATVGWLRPDLCAAGRAAASGTLTAQPFDRLLVWGCALAVAGCAVWLCVVTTVLVADAVAGRPCARRGVPATLRSLVLGLCGLAVATGLTAPAVADPGPGDRPAARPALLRGLVLPDRPTTTTHVSRLVVRLTPGHSATADETRRRTAVVAPGDTLWSLATAALGSGASDAEVARHSRAIYRANRSTIGPDPDLILPGQRLRLPKP